MGLCLSIVHACSCPEKDYVRQPAWSERLLREGIWLPAYTRQYHYHIPVHKHPPPSAPKNISSSIPFLKVSDNFQEHFLQPIFFVNRLPIENIFFLIDYFSLTDFLTDFYIKLQKCMCLDMYVCVNDMYYDVTVSQFCVASLY